MSALTWQDLELRQVAPPFQGKAVDSDLALVDSSVRLTHPDDVERVLG